MVTRWCGREESEGRSRDCAAGGAGLSGRTSLGGTVRFCSKCVVFGFCVSESACGTLKLETKWMFDGFL